MTEGAARRDGSLMDYPYRRVVTGLDGAGRSGVLFDDGAGFETASGATAVALLWQSGPAPADNSGVDDAASTGFSFDFAPGATKCILVDIEPTTDLMPPGMHATDTLDYVVLLAGALMLYLDDEAVELKPGDVVVNRGNLHGWRNRGPATARILVVNVDARPVGQRATG